MKDENIRKYEIGMKRDGLLIALTDKHKKSIGPLNNEQFPSNHYRNCCLSDGKFSLNLFLSWYAHYTFRQDLLSF